VVGAETKRDVYDPHEKIRRFPFFAKEKNIRWLRCRSRLGSSESFIGRRSIVEGVQLKLQGGKREDKVEKKKEKRGGGGERIPI